VPTSARKARNVLSSSVEGYGKPRAPTQRCAKLCGVVRCSSSAEKNGPKPDMLGRSAEAEANKQASSGRMSLKRGKSAVKKGDYAREQP